MIRPPLIVIPLVKRVICLHLILFNLKYLGQSKLLVRKYRFTQQIKGKLLKDIRQASNMGLSLRNEHFLADIESLTGRRVIESKRGRPVGWRKDKSEVKALN
jgi:hypothetical protein